MGFPALRSPRPPSGATGPQTFTQSFTATLSISGDLVKKIKDAGFAATLSFTGGLTKKIIDAGFAAILSFAGALTKKINDAGFAATLSFTGGLTKKIIDAGFAATLSFTGALSIARIFFKNFAATLSFGGVTLNDSYSESNFVSNVPIGFSNAKARGQSFTAAGGLISSVVFYLSKTGSPTGNATARLYALTGTFGSTAIPTGAALATSDPLDVSTLTGSNALVTLNFTGANQYNLTPGAHYGIALDGATIGDIANFINIGRDGVSSTHPGNSFYDPDGVPNWTSDGGPYDLCFYVYSISGAPTLTRRISKNLAATFSSTGILNKKIIDAGFAATLSFTSTLTKNIRKTLPAATLSFIGNLATQLFHGGTTFFQSFAATLSPAGALTLRTSHLMAATLSFTGALTNNIQKTLPAATLSFTGAISRQTNKALAGALSFVGILNRRISTQFLATFSPTGGLLTKNVRKILPSATLSFVGAFKKTFIFARTSFTATRSFTGVLSRLPLKSFTGTFSPTGTLTRKTSHLMAATLSFAGALTKNIRKTLPAATLSFVGVFAKGLSFIRTFAATLSFTGALKRQTGKALSGTLAPSAALNLRISHLMTATLSFAGALTKNIRDAGFTATLSFVGNLKRQTGKSLSATFSPTGVLAKKINTGFTATFSPIGTLTKNIRKGLSGTLSFAGALAISRMFFRAFTATLNFTGALKRQTNKSLSGSLVLNATLTKQIRKIFSATLSFIGALATQIIHAGQQFFVAFTATLNFTGALQRRTGKSFNATLNFVTTFARFFLSGFEYLLDLYRGAKRAVSSLRAIFASSDIQTTKSSSDPKDSRSDSSLHYPDAES